MVATGWTEAELAATSPQVVARLRHALYAQALRDAVRMDVDHELQTLSDATVDEPKAKERLRRRRISESRERLHIFRGVQAKVRAALHLDDPEPIPDDEP